MAVNLALRILVKIVVVFAFLLPLALFHGGISQFLAVLVFIAGIFSIFETLRIYARLQLRDDVLTVDRAFDGKQQYTLPNVEAWKENKYYLRGHLHRTLILFFNRQRIIISLYNDAAEFENLSNQLHSRYKDRQVE